MSSTDISNILKQLDELAQPKQLPALFKPQNISPVLGSPEKKNPMSGYFVGGEGADPDAKPVWYAIRHRDTGHTLSSHKDEAAARDEMAGLGDRRQEYKLVKTSRRPNQFGLDEEGSGGQQYAVTIDAIDHGVLSPVTVTASNPAEAKQKAIASATASMAKRGYELQVRSAAVKSAQGMAEGSHSESDEELENFLDSTKPELDRLYKLAKTSKKAKAAYYELKEKWDDANSKLYGLDEQGVAEGSVLDTDTTGYTKYDMDFVNNEINQIKKIQAKLLKIPGFTRKVNDKTSQLQLAEKIFNLMKRGHTFDGALVLAQKNPSQQGVAEGMNDWALKDKPKVKSIPQTSGMNSYAMKGDVHNKAYDFPPTYYDKDGKDMYGQKKPELKSQTEGASEAKVIGHVGDVAGHGKVVQCDKCDTDLRDDHGFALDNGKFICRSGKCSMRQAKNRLAAMAARGEKPRWRKDEDVAEANFVGDTPVSVGGATMKKIQVGDTVKYFGQKATVDDMSSDRKQSRITYGGITKNVLTSDLTQLGQGMAEGAEQDYLSQIPNLTWKPVSRSVWNSIQDEGLDEEQDKPKHTDWIMASLTISPEDARALQAFDNDAIEDFNRFDIHLKSRYPGLTDLIDYDRGTVTIVKPIQMQGVAEGDEPGYVKYEQMKDKISSVLIKLYNQGKDEETIKQMRDRVARHLGYDPTDSIFQDAWMTSFNDASLDGSLNQDSEDDYTDYSMRQGERGNPDRFREQGVAEGSSSPDVYKDRLASIQSLRYDNPQEYAKQYRALLQAMPEEHAAHANQVQKGSYSPGERGSGTGRIGGVTEGERTMSRAAKGYEKYGKAGMQALAKAGREGKDLDKVRDKYDKYEKKQQGVAEEASPMIKPPSNRFDSKKEAFAHAKSHGGKVFKSTYTDPNTGNKNVSFVVKKDQDVEEGLKQKLAAAALAGSMAMGASAGGVSLPGSGGSFTPDAQQTLNQRVQATKDAEAKEREGNLSQYGIGYLKGVVAAGPGSRALVPYEDAKKELARREAAYQKRAQGVDEVAPPGAKAERMVKHIKQGYAKDGKLTGKEKAIAYATTWKAHNQGQVEEASADQVGFHLDTERAYNAVMERFGDVVEQDQESGMMTVPRRYWLQLEQVAHDADGIGAIEAGGENIAVDEVEESYWQPQIDEAIAQEDVLDKEKRHLGDYLQSVADAVKHDAALSSKDTPVHSGDTIGSAVKTVTTDDGHDLKIHGNEDDGFRISIKGRPSRVKFKSLDEAGMACEMYRSHRRHKLESADYIEEQ